MMFFNLIWTDLNTIWYIMTNEPIIPAIPKPNDENSYIWDEETLTWIEQ